MPPIGRIFLQGPDGKIHDSALYDLPMVLREPILYLHGGVYQQCGQTHKGNFIYRYQGPVGHRPSDPDVKEFRNTDSPDWDGEPLPQPIATMADVKKHFDALVLADGVTSEALALLHQHFIAASEGRPF